MEGVAGPLGVGDEYGHAGGLDEGPPRSTVPPPIRQNACTVFPGDARDTGTELNG